MARIAGFATEELEAEWRVLSSEIRFTHLASTRHESRGPWRLAGYGIHAHAQNSSSGRCELEPCGDPIPDNPADLALFVHEKRDPVPFERGNFLVDKNVVNFLRAFQPDW